MKKLKLKNLKIGSLVQPIESSLWFPIDEETIDVIYLKDNANSNEELTEGFNRSPLIYMGKDTNKKTKRWIDPLFKGKHRVLLDNKIYYVVTDAWNYLKKV